MTDQKSMVVAAILVVGWCGCDRAPAKSGSQTDRGAAATCIGKGMTWVVNRTGQGEMKGIQDVGCGTVSRCNPYKGDTSCQASLPILCIQPGTLPHPGTKRPHSWSGGRINITAPISGCKLTSPAVANNLCKNAFGTGWRMAGHHDGGWGFWAYGDITYTGRMWTHINDQRGNCWDWPRVPDGGLRDVGPADQRVPCGSPRFSSDCSKVTKFQCGMSATCSGSTVKAKWHHHVNCPASGDFAGRQWLQHYTCTYTCPKGCARTSGSPYDGASLVKMFCIP